MTKFVCKLIDELRYIKLWTIHINYALVSTGHRIISIGIIINQLKVIRTDSVIVNMQGNKFRNCNAKVS